MIRQLLYLDLCFNTAGRYLSLPVGIAEKGALAFLVLDRLGVRNFWVLAIAGVLFLLCYGLAGYVLLQHVEKTRISLQNEYNPEIQFLVNAAPSKRSKAPAPAQQGLQPFLGQKRKS